MAKNGLWTKDFSLITAATVLTAIGGEAMTLPVSLLVFDETKSTLLAAVIMVCGVLPDIFLPILIAPIIDNGSKKNWIVRLDILMGILFAATGLYVLNHSFNYWLYVVFTLIIGTISVFYRLSYTAWYPDLIPEGLEQQGYAVSGTIYPTVTIVMAPVAAFLYKSIPMGSIFLIVASLTVFAVITEVLITDTKAKNQEKYGFAQYKKDMAEGFEFIKKEKGIRNIYSYISITSGTSGGVSVMTQAFFQTQPYLTVTMLGFLTSGETIGRVIGGLLQYRMNVPAKKRYALTKFVYTFYDAMDAALLWMPYPMMLANRFLCGVLGATSANIRHTAVQSYLPQAIRARINGFFDAIFAVGAVAFQMLAGFLGQYFPYRFVGLGLGLLTLLSMILLIWIPSGENRPVYEATRLKTAGVQE